MEQLSGLDAAFVYAETAGAAHVTFFGIYDPSTAPGGTVTFDDVVAHIGSRLGAPTAVFRSVLARVPFDLDHPYWVRDENFELSQHLHHLTLPRPGGWRQLCDQSVAAARSADGSAPASLGGLRHRRAWQDQGGAEGRLRGVFQGSSFAVDGVTGLVPRQRASRPNPRDRAGSRRRLDPRTTSVVAEPARPHRGHLRPSAGTTRLRGNTQHSLAEPASRSDDPAAADRSPSRARAFHRCTAQPVQRAHGQQPQL